MKRAAIYTIIICTFVLVHTQCYGQEDMFDCIYSAYCSGDSSELKRRYELLCNSCRWSNNHDGNVLNYIGKSDLIIETVAIPHDSCATYYAFILSKKSECPHLYKLFEEQELIPLLDKSKDYFNKSDVVKLVLSNIQNKLHDIKRIYLVPSGKLCEFALEYCMDIDGQRLCDKYEFYRLTSSSEICVPQQERKPYSKVVLFGGIDIDALPEGLKEEKYDGTPGRCYLQYLQESKESIERIDSYLKSKGITTEMFKETDASESRFKSLSHSDVDAFVIETHGIFTKDYNITSIKDKSAPLQNQALLLTSASYVMIGGIIPPDIQDGILTAKEISQLNLKHIDLAVISACKSALGDIRYDGVYGLMRGFKLAGVHSLVMTTDNVYDYVSGKLWEEFMKNIANGMTKRQSLLKGLDYIRKMDNGRYSHPKYWTSFILIDGLE